MKGLDKNFNFYSLSFTVSLGLLLIFVYNIFLSPTIKHHQFTDLADSFMSGHLYLDKNIDDWHDTTEYKGKHYWPQGPIPALFLIPTILVLPFNHVQGFASLIFNFINFYLLYKICRKLAFNAQDAVWLSIGYIFASAYITVGLMAGSWYYAQVVATTFTLLAIDELLNKKRFLLIGFYISLMTGIRLPLILASSFFILNIYFSKDDLQKKIRNIFLVCLPIIIMLLLLGFYNYLRFDNFFDSGYGNQKMSTKIEKPYGLWNIKYFPTNIYYLFLKGPSSWEDQYRILHFPYIYDDSWGLSILFTSPFFIWAFTFFKKNKVTLTALVTILILLIPILGFCATGYQQYGYRYALDFYPFLFLILLYSLPKSLKLNFKLLIMFSFLFNIYLAGLLLPH